MIQSWDFVDSKLAKRLKECEQELNQLKNKQKQINNNPRIGEAAKQKLLAYNDKCISDMLIIQSNQKDRMADYFDKQTQVLTKNQVRITYEAILDKNLDLENTKINTSQKWKGNSMLQLTKLTFDQDNSFASGRQFQNSVYISKRPKENPSESLEQNCYKLEFLDTTGRFTNKTLQNQGKHRTIKSFQLTQTQRTPRLSHSFQQMPQINKKSKLRAKISLKKYKRIKCRLYNRQFQLYFERLINKQAKDSIKALQQNKKQDKQLIELLYCKIDLLQSQQHSMIGRQKSRVQQKYKREVIELRQKYEDLTNLQNKNCQLQAKRRELIKMSTS